MKKTNPLLIAIFILITLIAFIFSIGLLYSHCTHKHLHQITLTEWQQFSNLVYGASGIILGYLYFKSKIDIDSDNAKKDRIRNRVTYIREELILIKTRDKPLPSGRGGCQGMPFSFQSPTGVSGSFGSSGQTISIGKPSCCGTSLNA